MIVGCCGLDGCFAKSSKKLISAKELGAGAEAFPYRFDCAPSEGRAGESRGPGRSVGGESSPPGVQTMGMQCSAGRPDDRNSRERVE